MALGSELKTEVAPITNGKLDAQELAHEDESNDSGHSSVNTPEATEQQGDKLVKVTIQPSCGEPFDLHLQSTMN
uniref:Uncharacterized protein n=1 Tax=Caenorhabditis japonica TaxID=281687 RepID=A0A8R1EQG9_CAEJA